MNIDTLVSLCRTGLSGSDRDVLIERSADGGWTITRSERVRARIAHLALGLRDTGVGVGDRVALMSPNRVDWIVCNLAILSAGAVPVPIYATQAHDQVTHILHDCTARVLVVDSDTTLEALRASNVPLPQTIRLSGSGADTIAALEEHGADVLAREPQALAEIEARLSPDDLAVLIYTSGTTGIPKGVMLTHRNIASNAIDSFSLIEKTVKPGDAVLSILPYAHIYESTNVYGYFLRGLVIYVNHKIEALLDDLRAVEPVVVFAVPRIFERMLVAILSRAKTQGGVRGRLIPWALTIGREYMRTKTSGRAIPSRMRLQYAIAHTFALKKIRGMLGLERLKFFCSGSAPLHDDTQLTFLGFEVTIMEGYGLTECSPVVTVNHPERLSIGTVGPPIENVELKIAPDGELLVRGPNVMKGYYNDPVATAEVIIDGWFHTGDIATIAPDGYVKITDRKKELFKTSGGKYVAPSRVESAILRSIYVNQAMVFGNGRTHPAALVSPNWVNLRAELDLPAIAGTEELAARSDVHDFMQREIMAQTSDLGPFEQIRWIGVLPRDLTIESGELSPTQKIKRRVIEDRYAGLIERVYAVNA